MKNKNNCSNQKMRYIRQSSKKKQKSIKSMSDGELLENIISHLYKPEDANKVMNRINETIVDADELINIDSLCLLLGANKKRVNATLKTIKRLFHISNSYVATVKDIYDSKFFGNYFVSLIGNEMVENIAVCYIGVNGYIIDCEKYTTSSSSSVVLESEKIEQKALSVNACGVVMAHNHPSGFLEASNHDYTISKKFKVILMSVGVTMIEHYIVNGKDYIELHKIYESEEKES